MSRLTVPQDQALLETFADSLAEIIPGKLQEIMERQDELLEYRKLKMQMLSKFHFKDSFDEWFWYTWFSIEFAEYDQLNEDIKYWLRLSAKTSKNKVWEKSDDTSLSEETITASRETPIEDIYEGDLTKNGNRFRGRCPFHEERSASFFIFTDDNHFYCFGCHAHGDVLTFYMKFHEVGFHEAVKALLSYG